MGSGPLGGPRPFAEGGDSNISIVYVYDHNIHEDGAMQAAKELVGLIENAGYVVDNFRLDLGNMAESEDVAFMVVTVRQDISMSELMDLKKMSKDFYGHHHKEMIVTTRPTDELDDVVNNYFS